MPPGRIVSRRRLQLRRRKQVRIAQSALKQAVSELGGRGESILKEQGLTTRPRIIPLRQDPGAAARATTPDITFTVNALGKLTTRDPLRTARHEVGHVLLNPTGPGGNVQHSTVFPIAATESSAEGLRRTQAVARMSPNRRATLRLKTFRLPRTLRGTTSTPGGVTSRRVTRPPGFDPVKSRIKQKFARRLGLDF